MSYVFNHVSNHFFKKTLPPEVYWGKLNTKDGQKEKLTLFSKYLTIPCSSVHLGMSQGEFTARLQWQILWDSLLCGGWENMRVWASFHFLEALGRSWNMALWSSSFISFWDQVCRQNTGLPKKWQREKPFLEIK